MALPAEWQSLGLDERRSALIEVAREQFLQFGFKKTTLDDVASAAGLQKSSLYHYFQNKEDLFLAVVCNLHEGLFQKIQEALSAQRPILDELADAIDVVRNQTATWKPKLSLLFSELHEIVPIVHPYAEEFMTRINELYIARMQTAVERGELRPMPIEETVVVMNLFVSRALTARELTSHHEMAAADTMRYVRVLFEPYITKS